MFKAWLALLEKDSVEVHWSMCFRAIEIHVIASKIPKPLLYGKPAKDARGLFFFLCAIIQLS
jgi:hypothetical protein